MTEAEWLSDRKFDELYAYVAKSRRCSRRVKRLLAVAVCRRLDHLYPDPLCREAIDLVERVADGEASGGELAAMRDRVRTLSAGVPTTTATVGDWKDIPEVEVIPTEAIGVVSWLTDEAPEKVFGRPEDVCGLVAALRAGVMPSHAPYEAIENFWYSEEFEAGKAAEEGVTCALLRDVFRNPFRRVTFDKGWRTPTATALAQAAYDERLLPGGTLDSTRLAILADALEDAGCSKAAILDHLRGPGPHVRGCWVVDLVLGKS
jgi:hypothetical protein